MLGSELRLILKTSSVTPDFFYVFYRILSFSTVSQSFKKICVWEAFWARTSLSEAVSYKNERKRKPPLLQQRLFNQKMDNVIPHITQYPADRIVCFVDINPLHGNLRRE